MSVREGIGCVLMALGALFVLLAALGILRMPDLYTRMSASSKASTLGSALLVLGSALVLASEPALARAVALVAFLTLTAPVAAHCLGRAGYVSGVRPFEGTARDDLRERIERERDTWHAEEGPGG